MTMCSRGQEGGRKAELQPGTIHKVSVLLKAYTLSGRRECVKISGYADHSGRHQQLSGLTCYWYTGWWMLLLKEKTKP